MHFSPSRTPRVHVPISYLGPKRGSYYIAASGFKYILYRYMDPEGNRICHKRRLRAKGKNWPSDVPAAEVVDCLCDAKACVDVVMKDHYLGWVLRVVLQMMVPFLGCPEYSGLFSLATPNKFR